MRRVLVVLAFLGGCAELPPVKSTVDVSTLRVSKEPLGTADVSVALELITPDNLAEHRGIVVKAQWREIDQSMVYTGRGVSATKVASAKLALLPLPAFIIRIANRTDAPISFGRAQLALEDDRGHR